MPWRDFRDFLDGLRQRDQVKVVHGADPELELGTLVELMCERQGPMLLFENIQGYSEDYRIAAKPYATTRRSAIALDLPEDASAFELFKLWRERIRNYAPIPPREVATGPVMERVQEGADVDLTRFPVPRWHEKDGGPYFGTGCTIITMDPEEQWVNVGTYRAQLHDGQTTGIDIAPYHHGNLQMQKWWARGEHAPVAIAISPEPSLFWASTEGLPWADAEYEYAGFIKGEPIDVIRGPRTRLPLPATAELIVEGLVPPPSEEQRTEGPFGEFTGYYAGGEKQRPVIHVQAVYHRASPILHGEPPLKPPVLTLVCPPSRSVLHLWESLERAGLPGVKGTYALNLGNALGIVVAIQQQYAGHARQVGRVASGLVNSICRMVIVVEDDIDPSNPEEVLWAIATRSDPESSWEVQPECPVSSLDPMVEPARKKAGRNLTSSRALIVACRPWEWRDEFPPVNRASEDLRQRTLEKWRAVFAAAQREPTLSGV
jgi:4-hydroxy-3-polyprenylbenzoate decarboxylase